MKNWNVALWGKHPACSDYIHLGTNGSFVTPVVQWVQCGYERFCAQNGTGRASQEPWQFWMLPNQQVLLCGLLAVSKDSNNRTYPLLMIGYGKTASRKTVWEDISRACRKTWQEMENIWSNTELSVRSLDSSLQALPLPKVLPSPRIMLPPISQSISNSLQKRAYRVILKTNLRKNPGQTIVGIKLVGEQNTLWDQFILWQNALKETIDKPPSMMFLNEKQQYVEFFYRPLQVNDFIRMYTLS
ncbi:type VI secretion system-associated protein TagF [candidate division CSSED10-310 bacterium]|uniref:Type VI secretion system-associated protein TagF n=1 Tax=candidate division CSSED10-310 bacterium TaxID=2855610 RepID=A0ABV6Z590_UNCC1